MEIYSCININNIDVTLHLARHVIIDCQRYNDTVSPYTRIYIVKEGQGTLRWKDREIPFTGGNIYILPAEVEYVLETTYFEKIYFHISVLTQEKYDIFKNLDEIYHFPYNEGEYDSLYALLMSESYYDKIRLKMNVLSILVRLLEKYTLPESNIKQYSQLVKNTLLYIHQNAKSSLRVSDIADRFFTSESRIRNTFREELGVPIGKYIDDLVFAKAKDLLSNSTLKISQISTMLGFCDQFYFSQTFKKNSGFTPSQFRQQESSK